jgi:hypothetical protein
MRSLLRAASLHRSRPVSWGCFPSISRTSERGRPISVGGAHNRKQLRGWRYRGECRARPVLLAFLRRVRLISRTRQSRRRLREIVMGLWVLGAIALRLPTITHIPTGAGPSVVGLVFALVASPCASPVLVAVLAAASKDGSALQCDRDGALRGQVHGDALSRLALRWSCHGVSPTSGARRVAHGRRSGDPRCRRRRRRRVRGTSPLRRGFNV